MKAQSKKLSKPDETRNFGRGKLELVKLGDSTVGKFTFQPGWRWSEHVRPIAGTQQCEAEHFMYQATGRMHVKLASGEEFEVGPGEVAYVPPGHDAWVVGDDVVTGVDWSGATNYAKKK